MPVISMVIKIIGVVAASVGTAVTLLFANGVYLYNKFKTYLPDLNNRTFWGTVKGAYNIIPEKNKISLIVQFGVLILATIGVLIFTIKQKTRPILSKATFIKSANKTNSGTDLDTLHRMLLSKKALNVGDIERAFRVTNEVAMGWCKTLENADLALIDYPTFKKPILRLPEEKEREDEIIEDAVKKARDEEDKKSKNKHFHFRAVKNPVVKSNKIDELKKVSHNVRKEIKVNKPRTKRENSTKKKSRPVVKKKTSAKKKEIKVKKKSLVEKGTKRKT